MIATRGVQFSCFFLASPVVCHVAARIILVTQHPSTCPVCLRMSVFAVANSAEHGFQLSFVCVDQGEYRTSGLDLEVH